MTRVLGFAGSLRKDSYNRALLRAARELAAEDGIEVEIFEIGGIPPYNQDDEGAMPAVVRDFKSRIEQQKVREQRVALVAWEKRLHPD